MIKFNITYPQTDYDNAVISIISETGIVDIPIQNTNLKNWYRHHDVWHNAPIELMIDTACIQLSAQEAESLYFLLLEHEVAFLWGDVGLSFH